MKRLSLFIFFFFIVTPIFAQSKPILNPKILEAPGPIPEAAKVAPQVASVAPWSYAVNLANAAYQFITGETGISFQEAYTIKTINVRDDGEDIQRETTNLTPKKLQDNNLKLVTYDQHMTANHVQCFYDEDGGNDHRPIRKIFKPVAISWNKIRAVVVVAAYMTPFKLPIEGLNLFMQEIDESVTPDNGLPCGTQATNLKPIGLFDMGDTDQEYDENQNAQWTADEFCPDKLQKYLDCLAEPEPSPIPGRRAQRKNCSLKCSGKAHTVYSVSLPAARETVDPKTGRGENNLCTGYTCSYLSKAVNDSERLQFTNGTNTQDHVVKFAFIETGTTSDEAAYYGEYSRRQAMIAKRCSNLSRGAPGFNEADCTFPIAKPTPPGSTFGDVCQVADAYGIPCCQLQGVMELETGSGASTGSGSCGNFNCCHGDACGPAQILCGQYDAFNGKDNLDMCSPVGAAELLSRAMLLKLCQAAGKCNSYDWATQGKIAEQFKVADGNYTAAAYFYGLANGCSATACSQYRWGAGKGYCDSVESFCKTGQVLPDNTSPAFCAQCNEEIVRAGQSPIQCTQ